MSMAKSVLCIPGPWVNFDSFVAAVGATERYLCAGDLLIDLQAKSVIHIRFEPKDKRMAQAFRATGSALSATTLKSIERHRSVLYLVSLELNLAGANALMRAAAAVLDAGGLAVKVETAGLAHEAASWQELCKNIAQHSAHQAFVVYVSGANSYSCGMHNLGLYDALVEAAIDPTEQIELLRIFCWYQVSPSRRHDEQVAQAPLIQVGQTFATADAPAPSYRITLDSNARFAPDDPFYNPFGTWCLRQTP
jgi:hypothetical protein